MKISKKQYIAACEYAADVYSQTITAASAVRALETEFGINPNSARDFIEDYKHLCKGKVFQRAMSGDAMRHFMSHIALKQGPSALINAIHSLDEQIKYYEKDGKRTLVMRKVLREFGGINVQLPRFVDSFAVRSAMRSLPAESIRLAFDWIDNGAGKQFGLARDYFVAFRRKRYPAKRVIGVAMEIASGHMALPDDFSSGVNSLCFLVLRTSGYPAVGADGKIVGPRVVPDKFVAGALAAIDESISLRKRKGQGYGLTQPQRVAVELAAMAVAKTNLRARGFTKIRDVSKTEPCDYRAEINGEEWFVEVKGTTSTSADQILLTAGEYRLHQQNGGRTCLIVVSNIVLNRKNDTAAGGKASVSLPWKVENWIFEPTLYRVTRADDCE